MDLSPRAGVSRGARGASAPKGVVQMYGTVMVGRLVVPFAEVDAITRAWEDERGSRLPGYLGQSVLLSEDGTTVVAAIRFADKASYDALGADPEQDAWWTTRMSPCFEGDVSWTDGQWMR